MSDGVIGAERFVVEIKTTAALRRLRAAVERGFINYPLLAKHALLEPLGGDAGFENLMLRV